MSESTEFVQKQAGGAGYGCMLVMLVFPVMAVGSFVGDSALGIGSAVIACLVLLAIVVTFVVRDEHRVELGPSSIRATSKQSLFGITRSSEVKLDVALTADSRVKQINTRTPASRGGWNHGSSVHFPGGHVLPDTFLGGREIPDSQYNRLTKALKEQLGDRFTVEEKV
ncbi:MAG: hypothetical protein J0L92_21725 [Deltaproteobacteria bacterium]|nr:hypothetical protein [Deltaproteobacteria bacterium]